MHWRKRRECYGESVSRNYLSRQAVLIEASNGGGRHFGDDSLAGETINKLSLFKIPGSNTKRTLVGVHSLLGTAAPARVLKCEKVGTLDETCGSLGSR